MSGDARTPSDPQVEGMGEGGGITVIPHVAPLSIQQEAKRLLDEATYNCHTALVNDAPRLVRGLLAEVQRLQERLDGWDRSSQLIDERLDGCAIHADVDREHNEIQRFAWWHRVADTITRYRGEVQRLQSQMSKAESTVSRLTAEREELLARAWQFDNKPHLLFSHLMNMASEPETKRLMDEAYHNIGEWKKAGSRLASLIAGVEQAVQSWRLPEECPHDSEPDICDGCRYAMEQAHGAAMKHLATLLRDAAQGKGEKA